MIYRIAKAQRRRKGHLDHESRSTTLNSMDHEQSYLTETPPLPELLKSSDFNSVKFPDFRTQAKREAIADLMMPLADNITP